MARLIGRTGPAAGQDIVVADSTRLGASAENDVRIAAQGVSRRHARVWREGTQYFVEDFGATNGTFLNGDRIQREALRHLDVITLGKEVDLIFLSRENEPAPVVTDSVLDVRLEFLDGPEAGTTIDVPKGEITFGRAPACNVVIASQAVSKVHARLQRTGSQIVLQDLGSANSTFVNGRKVESVVPIANGDMISFAGVRGVSVSIKGQTASGAGGAPPAAAQPAFDQEWKTRFVWVPEELAAIEKAREEAIALAALRAPTADKDKKAAAAAPKPAAPAPKAAGPSAAPPAPAAAAPPKPVAPPAPVAAPAAAAPPPKPVAPPAPVAAPPAPVAAAPPPRPVAPPAPVAAPPAPAAAAPPPKPAAPPTPAAAAPPPKPITPPAPVAAPPAPVAAAPPPKPVTPPAPVAAPTPKPAVPAEGATIAAGDALEAMTVQTSIRITGIRLVGGTAPISLGLGTFLIGRGTTANVRIEDPQASRSHASIVVAAAGVTVEDLKTVNGTRLNGVEVKAPVVVKTGDVIKFGGTEFKIEVVTS